jgi:hypothetical protein
VALHILLIWGHDFIPILLVTLPDIASPKVATTLAVNSSWCIAVLVHEGLEKPLLELFRPRTAARVKEFLGA